MHPLIQWHKGRRTRYQGLLFKWSTHQFTHLLQIVDKEDAKAFIFEKVDTYVISLQFSSHENKVHVNCVFMTQKYYVSVLRRIILSEYWLSARMMRTRNSSSYLLYAYGMKPKTPLVKESTDFVLNSNDNRQKVKKKDICVSSACDRVPSLNIIAKN